MNQPQAVPIKIIMVGSISVGKTSLIAKYATGKKPIRRESTKNSSYISKKKMVNGINFEIKLWDTAGQEKYKSLTQLFTKDAQIAILVYSIIDEQSFNELGGWLKLVKSANNDNIIFGVVANKSDLSSEKKIPDEKGKEFAKSIHAEWRTTSAITEGEGIDSFINDLFIKYYNTFFNYNSNANSLSITLSTTEPSTEQKKKCCGGGDNNNDNNDNINKKNKNNQKQYHSSEHKKK